MESYKTEIMERGNIVAILLINSILKLYKWHKRDNNKKDKRWFKITQALISICLN